MSLRELMREYFEPLNRWHFWLALSVVMLIWAIVS